ncbi:MAG TPA: lipoyl(octanoyl) transferase LipB [Chthoniobacterales bacterium]
MKELRNANFGLPDGAEPCEGNPQSGIRNLQSYWLGRIGYLEALSLQEKLVANLEQDTLLLLEHDPVYTIGRTPDQSSLRGGAGALPHPVIQTNRGGQATFHGPGQLVGYPIIDLNRRVRDLHLYLRNLEEWLIQVLASFGVNGSHRDGLTGVWVQNRKMISIGVGVRKWITMHGFAMNVARDLSGFQSITPCGINGVEMTSLSREAGRDITVEEAANAVESVFRRSLQKGFSPLPER